MAVSYDKEQRILKIDTDHTSYLIGITKEGYAGHIYYGKRLPKASGMYALRTGEFPFGPSENKREKVQFIDSVPLEYPTGGIGDYRESCLDVVNEYGQLGSELFYQSHKILKKKPAIPGLPSSFAANPNGKEKTDEAVDTLELTLWDDILKLEVKLYYAAFEREDVITRWAVVSNCSDKKYVLRKVYSAALDMDNKNFEMITLWGGWARERKIDRVGLRHGRQGVGSDRGKTSQQAQAFQALVTPGTNYDMGEVYAMNLVYSGNFKAQTELTQWDNVRMTMGMGGEQFAWNLEAGAKFYAPECVLTYSEHGLGEMARHFHDFYRGHMIRSPYLHKERPILINNWEATYFDFDSDKLVAIAKEAKKAGIEMLVMDDGWFGHRNGDTSSLGDWYVNEEKLMGGLDKLVQRVNKIGLKFGIWFEPEMVSPDSDLYREHPEWTIQINGRTPAESRQQYVLDLSRPEVVEYAYESVAKILRSANITYVKWDMNRSLCDMGSTYLGEDAQGELAHRYVLGLYEMQNRLVTEFPDLLLENCSAGGARFDPAMLYYSPQIWTSDDMDIVERLRTQEGTELIYPLSTMGAHVCATPNSSTGRDFPFETRANVAMSGTFGYELDITKLSKEDRAKIPAEIALYHKVHHIVAEGDYYRVQSWNDYDPVDVWGSVTKDKKEALFTYVQVLAQPNRHSHHFYLKGLDPDLTYEVEVSGDDEIAQKASGTFTGAELMNIGVFALPEMGDFRSRLYYLKAVSKNRTRKTKN